MRLALTGLLIVHALVHLMGVAHAFRMADLPGLTRPISPVGGVAWLVAGLLMASAAVAVYRWPQAWWIPAAVGIVVSMAAIGSSWADAKAGALVNGVVLVAVAFGALTYGPGSLRAQYEGDVAQGLARRAPTTALVTEADLLPLPEPVQRYLRMAGVVGKPRVTSVYARMRGRIRQGAGDAWMPFVAEQYDFFDRPARFFYFRATRSGLPVQGYHRYADAEASMHVRAAALIPVNGASGAAMTRAETVTLLNDMCLLAPATLIDPALDWEAVDARTAAVTYTNAGLTVRAVLSFEPSGALIDFRSEDRGQMSADGLALVSMPWSTPMTEYRPFGPFRLAAVGEGRWHAPDGTYPYIQLTIETVVYNRAGR